MAPSQSIIQSELGLLIIRLGRIWRRETDQALADHGLSQATALPLRILSRRGGKGIRQGVLAEDAGIEGPSLVRLIDLLQAEGLVERREDPTDRRAKLLNLTATGEAKAEEIDRVLRRVRAALFKDIPPDNLAIAFETLLAIETRANSQRDAAAEVEAGS